MAVFTTASWRSISATLTTTLWRGVSAALTAFLWIGFLVVLAACYSTGVTVVPPTGTPTTETATPTFAAGETVMPTPVANETMPPTYAANETATPAAVTLEAITPTQPPLPPDGFYTPTPTQDIIETPTPIITGEFPDVLVVTPLGGMPLAICGTIRVLDIGYLNIRQGPGVEYTKIGTLPAGAVRDYYCDFVVTSLGGQDVWVCISAVYQVLRAEPFCTSWVAVKYA